MQVKDNTIYIGNDSPSSIGKDGTSGANNTSKASKEAEFYFLQIKLLKSQRWTDKNNAFNLLQNLNDNSIMEELVNYTLGLNDKGIQYTFSNIVQSWQKRKKFLDATLATIYFFNLTGSDSLDIRTMANDQLEWFVFRSRRPSSFIIETLRRSWVKLTKEGRATFTEMVLTHKLQNLIPCIMENYLLDDLHLKITTTKAIFKTSDPRAKRFITKELRSEIKNEEYLSLLLSTLAEIGNFFDFYFMYTYLSHPSPKIRISAIHCFNKLLGPYSVWKLSKIFVELAHDNNPENVESNRKVKYEILNRLTRTNHKKSLDAIISIYKIETDYEIKKKLLRTLIEVKCKEKVPMVLEFYKSQPPPIQFELFAIFGEVIDPSIYKFLLDIIRAKDNELLILNAMDYIANYDKKEDIKYLEEYIKAEHPLLASYALSSILNHNFINTIEYIENFIEKTDVLKNTELTIIIIRALSSCSINGRYPHISDFITKIIQSNKEFYLDNAIDIAYMLEDETVFKTLISLKDKELPTGQRAHLNRTIAKYLMIHDHLTLEELNFFNDSNVVKQVDISLLNKTFIMKLLGMIAQYNISPSNQLFYQYDNIIEPILSDILRNEPVSELTSVILQIFKDKTITPHEDTLRFVCNIIYRFVDNKDRKNIIETVYSHPGHDNFYFFLHEFIKNNDVFNLDKKLLSKMVNSHE